MPSASSIHPPRAAARPLAALLLSCLLLSACGKQGAELGQGGSVVSGSAGPAGAHNASRELLKCEAPVATLALVENPSGYTLSGAQGLPSSPVPLVRLLAQQSGCFRVVDRSAGLKATVREQELKEAGILRQNGNTVAKGKGYEAQYTLTPSLTFSEQDAGRQVGGLLAMIPVLKQFVGAAEQVKLKEAQVALLLTDNETTEQLAAATGSVRVTDLGVGGMVLGKLGGAAGAGWSNSAEGKVIAAAFLDAHNQLVAQARMLAAKELPAPVAVKGGKAG
ncbi:curli biogenesis system outer membrane secretion channel CsgG [Paucibacter oligotrophus]|uniref:Curli biogenesis system outer membrane secretion channel CsgG n=1 Tax=Roseateles oligotrophus TaxID=1769250 RepID=A0A840L3J7_9BURK|nr:CsgG/HfaB family protein [Roseateles oligotrophus]MBB4842526.1 curli biogenesis system outer membrane secretion channel CsgG [Roseateles oligotrophus]